MPSIFEDMVEAVNLDKLDGKVKAVSEILNQAIGATVALEVPAVVIGADLLLSAGIMLRQCVPQGDIAGYTELLTAMFKQVIADYVELTLSQNQTKG